MEIFFSTRFKSCTAGNKIIKDLFPRLFLDQASNRRGTGADDEQEDVQSALISKFSFISFFPFTFEAKRKKKEKKERDSKSRGTRLLFQRRCVYIYIRAHTSTI